MSSHAVEELSLEEKIQSYFDEVPTELTAAQKQRVEAAVVARMNTDLEALASEGVISNRMCSLLISVKVEISRKRSLSWSAGFGRFLGL